MFERFWKAYPRGEDRQGAVAEWDRLRPDMELMHVMSRALEQQKQSEEWQRNIGIPYAVRWLRRRRWEDERRELTVNRASERVGLPKGVDWL